MVGIEQIGRYEIIEEIGRGGMAVVYRAYDPTMHRDVAIKVMSTHLLGDETSKERFIQEARTIAALQHRAIVPVYDVGEQDGQPYLVMQYMPGGSLADQLDDGPVSNDVIQRTLDRIGSALDKVHKERLVHRDVKPATILFDADGQPYLVDFGIVKLFYLEVGKPEIFGGCGYGSIDDGVE